MRNDLSVKQEDHHDKTKQSFYEDKPASGSPNEQMDVQHDLVSEDGLGMRRVHETPKKNLYKEGLGQLHECAEADFPMASNYNFTAHASFDDEGLSIEKMLEEIFKDESMNFSDRRMQIRDEEIKNDIGLHGLELQKVRTLENPTCSSMLNQS